MNKENKTQSAFFISLICVLLSQNPFFSPNVFKFDKTIKLETLVLPSVLSTIKIVQFLQRYSALNVNFPLFFRTVLWFRESKTS